jgi:hypothetical protein
MHHEGDRRDLTPLRIALHLHQRNDAAAPMQDEQGGWWAKMMIWPCHVDSIYFEYMHHSVLSMDPPSLCMQHAQAAALGPDEHRSTEPRAQASDARGSGESSSPVPLPFSATACILLVTTSLLGRH